MLYRFSVVIKCMCQCKCNNFLTQCGTPLPILCFREIIGARYYSKGYEAEYEPLESKNRIFFRSARDTDGHGTRTASTVAGSMVVNASLYGTIARSTARGVPSARLAIYKACQFKQCSAADVLSAFDDAIADGVDIIFVSLGSGSPCQVNLTFRSVLEVFMHFIRELQWLHQLGTAVFKVLLLTERLGSLLLLQAP